MKRPAALAAPLALALLAAAPALAQQPGATARQVEVIQRARVEAARETAQVRLLERTSQLRPLRVSASCGVSAGQPRLTVLADAGGTPRLVRYNSVRPDNRVQFTGYYDTSGNLRFATASASGVAGLLYDLTAEYDSRGRLLQETGPRRAGYTAELRRLPNLNVELLRRGLCPA